MLRRSGRANLLAVDSNPVSAGDDADLVVVEAYGSAADVAAVLQPFLVPSSATDDPDGHEREIRGGDRVRVLGAVVIPGDEVVFYLVHAESIPEVRRLFEARGIDSVRIVAAEWVEPRLASAAPDLADLRSAGEPGRAG